MKEKEPETLCLHAVEVRYMNAQPRTFCRTVRRVIVTGKVKDLRSGAEARASLNRAQSQ